MSKLRASLTKLCSREMRKNKKPEVCVKCHEGFAWKRDLDRHYKVHHKMHAVETGLTVDRIPCPYPDCVKTNTVFTRKDNLTRHIRKIHG